MGQAARNFIRKVSKADVDIGVEAEKIAEKEKKPPHIQIAFNRPDTNRINSGTKTTITMPHLRPGIAEGGFIDVCILTDSLPITGLYKKRFGMLSDDDANREGYSSVDEYKESIIAKYGQIGDDEQVHIVQFRRE
jgi:hypothetical protein